MAGFINGLIAGLIVGFAIAAILSNIVFLTPSPITKLWYGLVPCLNCSGSGKKDGLPCESCEGEGLVTVHLDKNGCTMECPRCSDLKKKDKAGYFNKSYGCNPPDYLSCNNCSGTGWSGRIKKENKKNLHQQERNILVECPECGGAGKIAYGSDAGYTNNPDWIYAECDVCKGAGLIFGYFDEKGNLKDCN